MGILALLAGCASNPYQQGRKLSDEGRYAEASDRFYDLIKTNPKDGGAWRELGINYYRQGNMDKAEEALKQSIGIEPDAAANLFLGLIYEKQNDYDRAINALRTSLSLEPKGDLKNMVRAHLDQLVSRKVSSDVKQALADETKLDAATIPQNTVAVVEFDDSYLPKNLAPLAKGLAEFTALDLAKIKSLKVVDRLKIDAIQAELKLSQSQMLDPSTAPRVGRLAGGRRLITGSVLGIGDNGIRMDGAVVGTVDSSYSQTSPTEGDLKQFFKVQKEFVFKVLDTLGITPTAEERTAIEEVPTESYLAFLAYSRGLDFKDRGMYQEAEQQFEAASIADAGFTDAAVAAKDMAAAVEIGSGGSGALESAALSSAVTAIASTLQSIQVGLINLNNFLPGGPLDIFGNTPDSPTRDGQETITIFVRGSLDGQP